MSIHFDGPLCRCGNRGCWELYASEKPSSLTMQRIPGPSFTKPLKNLQTAVIRA
ncbi:ROK family protein [Bacillus licheniformis]|nr:ROK family protein [Bacillus licheniformis]